MKHATYARSATTEPETLDRQRAALAAAYPSPVAHYEDAGHSGLSDPHDWPGLSRLLADAQAGDFDLLVIASVSRLSRAPERLRTILAELAEAGVRVFDLSLGREVEPDEIRPGI
jgi:DNA invertase Pin-like site-specific DNA recombinase